MCSFVFVIPVQAAKSEILVNYCNHDERSTPAFPLPSSELFMYKCMADQLAIPWPAVVAETTRSHDKGKKDCLWPRVDPGQSNFPRLVLCVSVGVALCAEEGGSLNTWGVYYK